jgi:hypothetical protein
MVLGGLNLTIHTVQGAIFVGDQIHPKRDTAFWKISAQRDI